MQEKRQIIEILQADVNLGLAPDHAVAKLAESVGVLFFKKGDYVFRTGDASEQYYVVADGRVILSKESPSGKIFTYLIAVRGMTLNAITCFKPQVRLFTARVAENATVLAIPCPTFKQWVLKQPDVIAGILNTMGDLLDGAYTRILDIIDESAEIRILNALTMLCSSIGDKLPLTNNDVAEMTGVSRETAARVISRLQEAGLLSKSRGAIKIIDKKQLSDLSTSPFFIL